MKTNYIIANPPYSKIGIDIATILPDHADKIVYLGTHLMVKVNCDIVSTECVYVESYCIHNVNEHYEKLKWVSMTIWLAYPGKCRYIPKKTKRNSSSTPWTVRLPAILTCMGWNSIISRDVLLNRNPSTSDILSCNSEEERDTIINELTETPPYNRKAMLKYGFISNFENIK